MSETAETLEQRRFTVAEYHRMAETGILAPDERVELLCGIVHWMSPKSRAHVIAANLTFDLLRERLEGRAGVYKEDPLRIESLDSELEPDVMVCSNIDVHDFGTGAMEPLLIVEVADSSLRRDLGEKAALYAEARVPEYWVVNLVARALEVFGDPGAEGYRSHLTLEPGLEVVPRAWPDLEIDVASLFPRDI